MTTNYLPVILSGGPGSGKTTLLNELARRGYACVAEAAREIIREQMATQGDALPWKNRRHYTAIMLKRAIADFDRYREQGGLFFFDRGIPDTLAYARLIGLYLDKHSRHEALARRYVPTVFLLPPWKSIYTKDTERQQNFTTAVRTFCIMDKTYRELGYRIIVLPKDDPAGRADRLLQWIRE